MGEFHQHPDGLIYVQNDFGAYGDTVANFALDAGFSLPSLPVGADDRIYTQDKRHAIMGGGNLIDGGSMPWPEGDAIIAALPQMLVKQKARRDADAATKKAADDARAVPAKARRAQFMATADTADLAQRLKNATPAQIDTWIDGNVTNLAQARDVLKAIVKLLATQVN